MMDSETVHTILPNSKNKTRLAGYTQILLFLMILGLIIYAISMLLSYVRADYLHKSSQISFRKGEFMNAYVQSSRAVKVNGREPSYHLNKAKCIIGLLSTGASADNDLRNEAENDILLAISLNEKNLVTKRDAIPMYYFLAVSSSVDMRKDDYEPYYVEKARAFYNELLFEYPDDVGIAVYIAKYQKKLSLQLDLETNLKRIYQLRPDLLEWYIN